MIDNLQILFEDNHCIAVAKPAGLLTQGPANVPSLESHVKAYLKEKHNKPGNVYLGVPHRLDRPVSGVVLFARNSKAAERLAEQFRERKVAKTYWGVVEGSLEPSDGVWEDWMRKIKDEARTEKAEPNAEGAKLAVLDYRVLSFAMAAFVGFIRRPGMHQIRVQAATRGHSLLGDVLYGSTRTFGPAVGCRATASSHYMRQAILHPLSYEPLTLTALF